MKNLFSIWREEIFKILSRDRFLSRDLAISLQNLEQFLIPGNFCKIFRRHMNVKYKVGIKIFSGQGIQGPPNQSVFFNWEAENHDQLLNRFVLTSKLIR